MTHLTPDQLVDAVDGTLAPGDAAHLASCGVCRRDAARLAALMRDATEVPVPEPSPLFWDHFSARVRASIAAEAPPPRGWSGWWRWPVAAPAVALALLLVALVATLAAPPTGAGDGRGGDTVANDALRTADPASHAVLGREDWELVAEMVGPLDWETAGAAGLGLGPGDVEALLLDLDEGERRELSRLLLGELARTKS